MWKYVAHSHKRRVLAVTQAGAREEEPALSFLHDGVFDFDKGSALFDCF